MANPSPEHPKKGFVGQLAQLPSENNAQCNNKKIHNDVYTI